MRVESGIVRYDEVIGRVSAPFVPLVERYLRIQELGHQAYLAQQSQGFYPDDLSPQELEELKTNPELQSPYKLIRRKDGQLCTVDYKNVAPFKSLLPQIASKMEETARFAIAEHLPQSYLIEENLRSQAQALRDADFERAMYQRLNTLFAPNYELFFGLLDRYQDTLLNRYYSWQGWIFGQDALSTDTYNQMVRFGLERTSQFLSRPPVRTARRVVAGNVLAFSGLAAENPWSGNTIPSEDRLRNAMGSLSYIFLNELDRKFDFSLKQAVSNYVPELTQTRGWEDRMKRAFAINLALHEGVGHTLAIFDETSEHVLKDNYTTLKELEAELLSFVAALRLPSDLADVNMKKAIIGASLSWGSQDIEDYKGETDPSKKKTKKTYARAWEMLKNSLESERGIEVKEDNWSVRIGDLDHLLTASRNILIILENAICTENQSPGAVARFVELYCRYPRSYLEYAQSQSINVQSVQV